MYRRNSNSRDYLAEAFLAGSATTFDRRGSAKWTPPFRHSQTLSEAPQVHSQSDLTSEPPKLRPRAPSLMETWKAYNIGIYPCLTLSLNDPVLNLIGTARKSLYSRFPRFKEGHLHIAYPTSAIDILPFYRHGSARVFTRR